MLFSENSISDLLRPDIQATGHDFFSLPIVAKCTFLGVFFSKGSVSDPFRRAQTLTLWTKLCAPSSIRCGYMKRFWIGIFLFLFLIFLFQLEILILFLNKRSLTFQRLTISTVKEVAGGSSAYSGAGTEWRLPSANQPWKISELEHYGRLKKRASKQRKENALKEQQNLFRPI